MRLLALETSTDIGTCALIDGDRVIERVCPAGKSHSETLLPLVRTLLAEAGWKVADLDGIAFGAGPGAFTGLRVACGATQGLAVAVDCPVIPVCGLEAMAEASRVDWVLSLLDARMGEIYAGFYARDGANWLPCRAIEVLPPATLEIPATGSWSACGNALIAYPLLAERLQTAGIRCLAMPAVPRAETLARIGARRLAAGLGIDAADAAPLYVRDKVAKTVAERLSEGGRA